MSVQALDIVRPGVTPTKLAVLLHGGAGGSGVVATETGLRFAQAGCDVHFISNRVPFRLVDQSDAHIWVHQVEPLAYPLFDAPLTTLAEASRLAEVIETYGIQLIHAHYAVPHATAAILARDMVSGPKPAVVTTLHGTDVTLVGLDRAYVRATRHAIDKSDAVTAVSQHLLERTVEVLGVERPISVISNMVDLERFRPGVDLKVRRRFAGDEESLLLHVSNFRPVKRSCDVIRILAHVRRERPTRLVMVGDGPDQPKAAALARDLGVGDAVTFLGAFPTVEAVMRSADVFLMPSEQEAFGLAALEAMASGVPVVGSTAGGLPEVVEHGVTGYLCEPKDAVAMAEAVLKILADPALKTQMAEAGRQRAGDKFSETDVTAAYARVYEAAWASVAKGA